MIGLITAADKYNIDNPRKAQFITYAVYWIIQKISVFIKNRNTNEESSLNVLAYSDGDAELQDFIEGVDYSFENVEEKLYRHQLRHELESIMNEHNSLREREVLKLHYGFDGNKCLTMQEISDIFGFTIARTTDIERAAFRKLKKSKWGRLKEKELLKNKIIRVNYNKYNKSFEETLSKIDCLSELYNRKFREIELVHNTEERFNMLGDQLHEDKRLLR